jgi:hypothetical protein
MSTLFLTTQTKKDFSMLPAVISPAITELQSQDDRLVMSDKALKREIELTAKASQPTADDNASLIAMVIANPDNFPTAIDNNAKQKAAWQKRAAIDAARQSLKPKLAAAKFEAASAVLKGIKPEHDKVVQKIIEPLTQLSHAYVELFDLGRQLRDKEVGWRNGVGDLLPALLEIFGATNIHSPIAALLHEAVRLGYVKAAQLPKELRNGQ